MTNRRNLEDMNIITQLLALNVIGICMCSKRIKHAELMLNLLANYTPETRPGLDSNGPVVVNISYNVVALTEINGVKGYIATVAVFDVAWIDERMTWKPEDYEGISTICIISTNVWVPKLLTTNPTDRVYTLDEVPIAVRYFSTGVAYWRTGAVMKTICSFQIQTYPFDVHVCSITMTSWGTFISEVVLNAPINTISKAFYSENAEWALTETSSTNELVDNQMSLIDFNMKFCRKSTFLVVNILIPITLLVF